MPPLASLVLLTFNNARHAEAAIRSAFAQTWRPLEIVISDDASTDRTWDIVQERAADCPADIRLVLRRESHNRGAGAHLCAAATAASGDVIVQAAGDDVSLPDRVALTIRSFADETVMAVAVGQLLIDDGGREIGAAKPPPIHDVGSLARSGHSAANGAAGAYRRSVFSAFAPIAEGIVQEDVILFFRAALLGHIAIVPDRLVLYRQHPESSSGSTGPQAASADVFAHRTRRYVESIVRVRRQQMADAMAMHAPAGVLLDLHVRLREEEMCAALIRRDLAALPRFASAVFQMPLYDAARAIAMHAAPRLWHRWINRAH